MAASANPENGQIVGGSGSISQAGALTQINQASSALAINWDSFNVGASEVVQFIQPDVSSVALNRITGGGASEIFGSIDANGSVFLINTAGVVFAPGSQINVANLVVSGLDMTVEDFMAGNYALAADGLPGAVVNHGTIAAATGGSVVLVGGQVVNTGLIRANYGRVTLAGAEAGYVDFDGDGLLRFEVTGELKQKLDGAEAAVTNSGVIEAQGGQVVMQASAARGIFDTLVNNEGIIEAGAISIEGGVIRLVAEGGDVVNTGAIVASSQQAQGGRVTLEATDGDVINSGEIEATSVEASGGFIELVSNADTIIDGGMVDAGSVEAVGGTIHALGNRVIVQGPSRLGSAGGAGGGTILIGGSYQGSNLLVRNASQTFVGADVQIDASAVNSGTGGTVIVWSDDYTWFFGTVSARGPPSGHGGFVEVSSHGTLAFSGLVDLRAGTNGTLLLDPTNIRICSACTTTVNNSGGNPATFSDANGDGDAGDSRLLVGDLTTQLNLSNVIVTTASGFTDPGNITVETAISWTTGNSLTLTANNHINVNAGITASGAGSLTLTGGTATGVITINAGISLNGGNFSATASQITTGATGTIAVGAGNIALTAEEIDLGANLSGTGTLTLQPVNAATAIAIGGAGGTGALDLTPAEIAFLVDGFSSILIGRTDTTGGITVAAVTFTDPVTLRSPSGGVISVNGTLTGSGNASVTLQGSTVLAAGITTADRNITLDGDVRVAEGMGVALSTDVTAGGDITITGTTNGTAGGGGESLTLESGTGAITFVGVVGGTAPLNLSLHTDFATSTGAVTFQSAVNVGFLVTVGQAYDVSLLGGGTFTGLVEFLNTGTVTLGNDVGDSLTFNGGVETAGNTTNPTGTNIAGSVSTSNDAITLGAASLTANATLTAGTATLSLAGVTGSTFDLTLEADEIDLTGAANSITGSGAVVLRPSAAGVAIIVAGGTGTGALELTAAELATVQDGHSGITIGRSDGTAGITINAVSFSDPVSFLSPAGGTITVGGTLTGTGNASITIDGSGATTALNANIITAGGAVFISDSVLVNGTRLIDTTNGDASAAGTVTIAGAVNGANAGGTDTLTIDAAQGAVDGTGDAAVNLQGAVGGGVEDLEGLTVSGSQVDLANVTIAGGNIAVSGTNIDLNGASYLTTTSGTITFTGPVDLDAAAGAVSVTSAGGAADHVSFSSTINDTGSDNPLVVSAGAGNVTLGGAIGGTGALPDLDLTGASLFLNGGSIVADGGAGGETVTFSGAVVLGSNVSIDTDGTNDNNVSFSSTINADDAAGQNRTLAVTAGGGTVNFGASVGATQALADLDVAASSITLNGASVVVNDGPGGATASFTGSLILANNVSVLTAGTNDNSVSFGAIDADNAATQDRTLTVTAGGGTVTFGGAVGATQALADLDVLASTINLNAASFNVDDDDSAAATVTFGGAVVLGANVVTIDTDKTANDSAVSFTTTINADNAGTNDRALVLNAGTGNVSFAASIGGSQPLADLDVTAGTITLGGATFLVNDGPGGNTVTFNGAVVLGASVTFNTDGANDNSIAFNGTLNADDAAANNRNVIITAGTGNVTFNANVGGTQPLGDLDITAGTIFANATSFNIDDDNGSNSTVTWNGAVVLGANVTIDTNKATGTDMAMVFNGTINADDAGTNNRTLTVDSGAGTVTFGGIVGGTQSLADLDVTGGTINLNTTGITVNDGAGGATVTFTGAVVLGANVAINTDGAGDNNISFTTTVNADNAGTQNRTLTITAGTGTVAFTGAVGGTQALADLDVASGGITFGAATTVNDQGGNTLTLAGGTGTISAASTFATGSNNVVFEADEIDFNGGANSVTGSGSIVLQPGTISESVGVGGGAGTLDVSDTDIAAIQDGRSSITIGRADGTGLVTVGSSTFTDPVTIRSGGATGDVTIAAVLNTTGPSPITIQAGRNVTVSSGISTAAASAATGTVTTAAISITAGAAVVLNSSVTTGNASITTNGGGQDIATSGSVTITATTGSISGSGTVTTGSASHADGGNDNDQVTSGSITLAAGGAVQLSAADALTIGAATVNSAGASDDATAGSITISGDKVSSNGTNGALDVSIGAATATGGDVITQGRLSVTTDGGAGDAGGIFITSGESLRVGALVTGGGSQNITITTSNVALRILNASESVSGDAIVLAAGTSSLDIDDSSFTIGAGSLLLRSNDTDLNGGANSIIGTGSVAFEAATAGTTVGIGGGAGTLNISTADVAALANGFSSITIGRADSTAALTFGSVTFVDNVLLRGGSIAADGTITGTGASVTLQALAGDITDAANNATSKITAATVILIASGSIANDGNNNSRFDVAGVTSLTINVGGSFAVRSTDSTQLTTLSLTVTPGLVDRTYALRTFTNLTLGLTDGVISTTCVAASECVIVSGTTWSGTGALNFSLTVTSGDIRLNDLALSMSGTISNTAAFIASSGNIFDHNTATSDDPNPPPSSAFNIVTSNPNSTDSVTLSAAGNAVGTGTAGDGSNGDIDVSGASNFTVVAATSSVFNNTAGVVNLEGTPLVNGLEDINLSFAGPSVTYTVNEACMDGASCITVTITNTNSLVYTGHTGDIYIVGTGISLTSGDVTLIAEAGGIFEATNNTTTNISTPGTVTLDAFTSIGTQHLTSETAGTVVVANAPIDLAAGFLAATADGGAIRLNELDNVTLQTITAAGLVHLTAGGSIFDDASNATRIAGTSVTLIAVGALGATGANNELDTTTTALTLVTGTNLFVANTGNLASLSITSTQAGDTNTYSLSSSAGLTSFALTDAGTNYTLSLVDDGLIFSFTGDEAISIGAIDVSATGTVALASTLGSVTDTDAGVTDITAQSLNVAAVTGINLDTAIDSLTASNTTSGGVDVVDSNGLQVITVSAPAQTVTLDAGTGAITDGNGAGTTNVTAMALLATAQTGIELDTAVDTLTTNTSVGNGNQVLREFDGLTDVSLNAGTGTITLTAGGTVDQSAGTILATGLELLGTATYVLDSVTNNVGTLAANTGALTYVDADSLTVGMVGSTTGVTSTGAVDLTAGGLNGVLTLTNAITATDQSVTLRADNMDLTAAGVGAGTGSVTLQPFTAATLIDLGGADAAGVLGLTDAELNQVTATLLTVGSTASGNLQITTTITPAGVASLALVSGGNVFGAFAITVPTLSVTANGAGGIGNGGADPLTTSVDSLTTNTSVGGGNQFIVEADGLTAVNLSAGAGTITLTLTEGALTDTDGAVDFAAAALVVTLSDTDDSGDDFGSQADPIGTDVDDLTVTTSAGTVHGSQYISDAGSLANLALDAGTGTVELAAAGAIEDSTGGDTDIIADTLVLTAGTGIGAALTVGLEANYITASSAAGDIDLTNSGAGVDDNPRIAPFIAPDTLFVVEVDLSTDTGSITFAQTGGASLIVSSAVTTTSGDITLSRAEDGSPDGGMALMSVTAADNVMATLTGGSGGMAVDAVSAGTSVTLTAISGINENDIIDGGSSDPDADVSAPTVTLMVTGTNSIGDSADPIETEADDLTATTDGDINLVELTGLSELLLDAGTGSITFSAGGTVLSGDGAVDISGVAATVLLTAGNFGSTDTTAGNAIQTDVDSLSVDTSTGNGNQFILESNGLTGLDLNAGTGNVSLALALGGVTDIDPDTDVVAGIFSVVLQEAAVRDFGTSVVAEYITTDVNELSVNTSAGGGSQYLNEISGLSELSLNAGTGDVFLLFQGSVLSADAAVDIIAASASLGALGTAGGSIGSGDLTPGNALETTVGSLSINASGSDRDMFIRETDGLSELSLAAGAGDINLFAGGSILSADVGVDIETAGAVTVVVAAGDFGSTDTTAGNAIETAVGGLSVDTSGANGSQFIRESDGLSELLLSAGTGDVALLSVTGSILSNDVAVDIIATNASIAATAGSVGDTDTAAGNALETSVNSLTVTTSGDQFLRESNGLTDLALTAGGGVQLFLVAGDILDTAADLADVTAATVALSTPAGAIGTGANPIEISGVSNLSLAVLNGFFATGDGLTNLTDLAITINSGGQITATNNSYVLTGFPNLQGVGTAGFGLYDGCCVGGNEVTIYGISATTTMNISITNLSGDIYLTDQASTNPAAVSLPSGGNITITAANGNIFDFVPSAGAAPADDSPSTDYSLRTTGAYSVTLNAPNNAVGAPGFGDIDVNGTGNLAINAASSNVSTSVALTALALTVDPVNDAVNINLGGATTVIINEACFANNACIQTINNSGNDFDFSLTAVTGDILLADFAILNIDNGTTADGTGSVTLIAQAGGIFRQNTGSPNTNIFSDGPISLSGATGITQVGSIGSATAPIAIAGWNTSQTGLSLARTNSGVINVLSYSALTLNGFSSTAAGATIVQAYTDFVNPAILVNTDVIQSGDITLEALNNGSTIDDVSVRSGMTVRSTAGDIVLRAADDVILASGSTIETTDAAGTILLSANFGDGDNNGEINMAGATVTSAATSADAITLRARTLTLSASTISATAAGGGVRLFSQTPSGIIEVGGTCTFGVYCVSDAELAQMDYDLLTVGEAGVQTGIVAFVTVSTAAGASLIANSGSNIYLDDGGVSAGIDSDGNVTLNSSASIRTVDLIALNFRPTNNVADLDVSGTLTLNGNGVIGLATERIEFAAGQDDVVVTNLSNAGIALAGLGNLSLASVTSANGPLDVSVAAGFALTTTGTISVGSGAITFTANEIDLAGGPGSIIGTAGITLQPVTATRAINLGSTSNVGGAFSITDADAAALADGFFSITIGRPDGQHVITVVDVTFTDPVLLRAPSGAGAVVDDADDSVTDLTAPDLTFSIGTGGIGQGAGGSLDTEIATLAGTSVGNVAINEATSVAVGVVNAGTSSVTLSAGGAITDANGPTVNVIGSLLDVSAVTGIDLDTGIAFLTASNTASGGINIADSDGIMVNTVSAPGQTVVLNAGTGFIGDNNGPVLNVTASLLDVTAVTGISLDTNVAFLTASNTGSSGIDISDADDIGLNSVTASGQAVVLSSVAGAITDNNGAATNITASTAVLSADTGIGSGDAIELAVSAVAATNVTSGNIELTQPAGNLIIGTGGLGVANAGGNIALTTGTGSLHIDEAINSGTGRTTLTSGNLITADGASVTTAAELVLSAVAGISPGCGGGCFLTDADAIQVTVSGAVSPGGIEIGNTGDVTLADITGLGYAVLNTNGGFNFTNTGSITVDGSITTGRVVRMRAFGGGTSDLNINANITAGTTTAVFHSFYADGDIVQAGGTLINGNTGWVQFQSGTGSIALAAVSAGFDVYVYAFNGAILDNNAGTTNVTSSYLEMIADTGISLDTNVTILYAESSSSGGIDVSEVNGLALALASAPGQAVVLNGGTGAITDANGAGLNVFADSLDVTAATGISVDTDINTLTASNTTSGGIDIADTNGLAVNTVTAAGQDVSLNAGTGALTDNNGGATNVTAGLFTATAATGIGLDTAIDFLTASNSGSGGISIVDTDGFAVNTVTASGQTVTLNGGTGAVGDNNAAATNVTASALDVTATSGIDLDTAIATLTASNTGSGGVNIADTDGFAVVTVTAAGQTVTLNGGTGTITDGNGVAVNIVADVLSAVSAQGIDLDTTINSLNGSTSGAGNVRFDETDDITVTSFTTANGAFTLTSNGNTTLTSVVSTTSNEANDITVSVASGDLTVGTVNAGTTAADVSLTATTGAILNSTSAVTGDVVTLVAQDGIGASGNRITTTATTLSATTTAAGPIWLNETDGAAISATAADGLIDIVTGGNTTLTSILSTTFSDANDITIVATAGDILVGLVDTDVANAGTSVDNFGDVSITASAGSINDASPDPDVTLDVRGDAITINGANGAGNLAHLELDGNTLNVSGGAGGIGINDLNGGDVVLALTSAGNISYGTGGNIFVDQVISTGGSVTLFSFGGSINDHADDLTTDIIGTTVTLSAYAEVGGNALNVLVPVFDALEALEIESTSLDISTGIDVSGTNPIPNAAAAPIVVRDIGGTTLADLDTVNGDITVFSDSAVAVGDVFAGTTTLSNVILDAASFSDAGAGDVTADLLTVDAAGPITLSTNVNTLDAATTAAGAITITEANGIALTSVVAFDGAVSVTTGAGGSIDVTTVTAAGQLVTLSAGGAITDANGGAVNVSAGALNASATTGIDLDTTIAELTASNTTSGDINIADTDGFTVNTVSAAGQTVTLNGGTGAITDNNGAATNVTADLLDVTAAGVDLDTAIDVLTLSSTGTVDISDVDDVALNTIAATGQAVTLTAVAGAILDNNGDGVTNVTASSLVLSASLGIELDTAITQLTASNTTSGGINIEELDGFALNAISAPGQAVILDGGTGAITDNNGAATNITANSTMLFATTGIGSGDALELSVGAVAASNLTSGNIELTQPGAGGTLIIGSGGIGLVNGGGNIVVSATESLFIGRDIDSGTGRTTLTTGNQLIGDGISVIFANELVLSAVNGIGAGCSGGGCFLTDANAIQATNTNNGVEIANTGDVVLADITALGYAIQNSNGGLNFQNTGTVTVADSITTGRRTSITASLGATADLNINANITAGTTGAWFNDFYADGDIVQASGTLVDGGAGFVQMESGNGSISLAAVSAALNVYLYAFNGAILDNNAGATNVSANYLQMYADTGISLDTSVTFLYAENFSSGGIDVSEVDGVALDLVSAPGQAVVLNGGTGAITDPNGTGVNVVADSLNITATTGISVDTSINTVTASNTGSGGIVIADTNGFAVNTVTAAGQTVTLNGGSGSITDNNAGATNVTASLFDATATTGIDLDTAIATLTATNSTSGNIDIADTDGFAVNTVSAVGQTVTLNGGTGAITDNNGVTTNVTATLLDATATTGIDLDTAIAQLTASNTTSGGINVADTDGFAVNTVTAAGQTVILDAGTGALTDNNAAATNVTATQFTAIGPTGIDLDTNVTSLTFTNNSGTVNISELNDVVLAGASTASGLILAAGGTITDGTDGDLAVAGNAALSGTAITLGNDAGNDTNFGSLTFSSPGTVSIAEDSATQFAGSSAADSLALTSAGAITQAGGSSVSVITLATFTTPTPGSNVILDQGNDFGTVSLVGANVVSINDTDSDASAVNDGLVLGTINVNSLTASTVGALSDNGNIGVSVAAVFNGSSITLGSAGETTSFGRLTFTSAGAVNIETDTGITLAGTNSADSLTLSANGAIGEFDGATTLNVTGLTTLTATNNNIALDNNHVFGTVSVTSAVNVVLATGASDLNGIVLGDITTASGGDLTVTAAAGNIDGSGGALQISGDSTFTVNNAVITVDNAGNNFTNTVSFVGATDVSVLDTTALELAGANLTGDLTVVAAGITASGAIVVGGLASFDAGAGNDLQLTNIGNNFNQLEILDALNVSVFDLNDITLANVTIGGNFTIVDADSVGTALGTGLSIVGDTSITTSVGDIVVDGANDFVGAVTLNSAGNVVVNDINNLSVALIDGANVTITAGGAVTEAVADGGTVVTPPPATDPPNTPDTITRGTDDIVVTGVLSVTAASFGTSTDPIEIDAAGASGLSSTVVLDFDILGGGLFVDLAGDVDFDQLSVTGATQVELAANTITVNADFNTGTITDIEFLARNIIIGGAGTITAQTLQLDARAVGQDVIGSIASPILLNMANGTDYRVPDNELNGFGFINASNFTGTDFNRIFTDSGQRIFLIANFTDLIASVQGSFITAQIFTIDSSQFRADLNIFGVDGAGILLPHDQCEDEESADCAKQ